MDKSFELISQCVEKIYNDEDVFAADVTNKELKDFLEGMNSSQFKQIESFFNTMPKLSHVVELKNPNTKVKSKVTLEGLDLFSLRNGSYGPYELFQTKLRADAIS